jgi:post-segregation antitoxin (ccd killing protein)
MPTLPIGLYARKASRIHETAVNKERLRSKAEGWHITKEPVNTVPLFRGKKDRKTELWTL